MRRDTRFQKSVAIVEAYNPYLVDDDDDDDEKEEIAMAECSWGKKTVMMPNPWEKELRRAMISTSQNQTSSLISCLRDDRSSCPKNNVMLHPNQLKNKKFCKFHNATSHSTNECRIFWQHIQRAI